VDIAVAALPVGADPGEVARSDPGALKAAVAEARPFLAFRLQRVLDAADLRSPEARARAAAEAMAVIAEHPNELVRDQYVMEVADRTRIDPDRLRRLPIRRRDGARQGDERTGPPAGSPRARRDETSGPEVEALRLAVHRPEDVADRLEEVLVDDELNLAAFRALMSAATLHEAIERADPGAAELLQRLAVEDADADPDDVLARLADRASQRALRSLEAEARSSAAGALGLVPTVTWVKLTVEALREPGQRRDATGRLVAWLVERDDSG